MANKFQNPWDVGGEYYNQNALHTEFLPKDAAYFTGVNPNTGESVYSSKSKEQLPDGVYWIKEVVEASKYGVPLPEFYFSNTSSNVAYVLGEDKEYPVKVEPGQVYIHRIEGAANKKTGVYKVASYGRLFADKDGNIKPSGPVANLWKALDSYTETGPKDINWIKEREAAGDMKWVRLYNTIQ